MPKILTSAALLGSFDSVFPDLADIDDDDDRVPGRDLAEAVLAGLLKRKFKVEGPFYEEPFFVLHCCIGGRELEVLCYIFQPAELDSVWAVECVRNMGFFARLIGRSEDEGLRKLVLALHEVLLKERKVRQVRWFDGLIPLDAMRSGEGFGYPQI